jgi:DNA-binding NtrC family response regulator
MNPQEVSELHRKNLFDLILLDLQMPDMDGFQVMDVLKTNDTDGYLPVLVITAQPSHKLRALQAGAKDFISKPFDLVEVKTRIRNMLEVRLLYKKLESYNKVLEQTVQERTGDLLKTNVQLTLEIEERKKAEKSLQGTYAEIKLLKDRLQAENIYLQQEVDRHFNFGEIVGHSDVLSHVFLRVEQVAPMNATVLLLGETGTGKGVVARAIHSSSVRKNRPLITVNCTTLPATLVESELFGRERGAFTGSDTRQIGRFELADGGTIFLDEIGEMPLELQSKLLRVIQDGEFERLGSPRTIKTDVRIIAATNRNLESEIRNGTFREDLFYRLNVFPITIPPLRQRKDDIPLLVNHFVTKFNKKIGKKVETVSKDTMDVLKEYHWPGNVRELESVIERAVIISQGAALQVMDRFDTFRKTEEPSGQDIKALVELEHDHVLQVLQKTGWRIEGKNGAAVLLGLNPSTLRARMRKYGIFRQ